MFALRGVLAFASSTVLVAAVAITVSGPPSAEAANSTSIEAETMSVSPSYAAGTARDSAASGGVALSLRSAATATKVLSLAASSTVVVRARGQRTCGSAPVMNLTVDGKSVSTVQVSASAWTGYTTPVAIPAGSHTIGVVYTNQGWSFFCTRSLLVDTVTVVASGATTTTTTTPTTMPTTTTTVPTTTTSTNPPTTPTIPTPVPAARMFNGDYSTGNFSQWQTVQTRYYNSSAANYQPAYPATVVSDPQKGYAGRFEVRSGDVPNFGGGERAEVQSDASQTGGTEGQTRWYQFSTKFDPTFPQNHRDLGWGLTNQWHSDASTGSPTVSWVTSARNGYWSLLIQRQSSPGVYVDSTSIFDVPLGTNWHDVKMQINWSTSDTKGWIRLWLNGVRQKFVNGADTYNVRTMIPGTRSVYYKEGYYRQAMRPTGIVYHAAFRAATEEGGLN